MLSVKGLLSGAGWSGRRQRRETNVKQSIFSALRFYNYRLFWLGQLVSVTGTFMQSTAQQWLVLTLTSSPVALGIVGALQFGPMLIPLGGAVADRFPRRNVLMFTQAAAGLLAFVLFLLTITHA
ncbi:MAG: MFS transporter, partial [Ktedonobacterales bacterium]